MDNEKIVLSFLEGMHQPISQVPAHLKACLTEDAVWGNCGFPPAVGIDDIMAKHEASMTVFGEYILDVTIHNIASKGDVVFTERTDVGRQLDGTEIMTVPVTGVFELRDGRICRWVDYFDPAELLQRISVLPDTAAFFAGKSDS
jgi:limonene-1,2-epoxide hydrolase